MLKRITRHIIPSPAALTFVWVGLGLFIITAAFDLFLSFPKRDLFTFLVGLSSFSFPALGLLFLFGAVKESRAAPRALLWGGVVLAMLGATFTFILGSYLNFEGGPFVGFLFCCTCSPTFLIPAAFMVFFIIRSWPQLRAALNADRAQRTLELLSARGEASFTEISQELDIHASQVEPLLQGWLEAGRMLILIVPRYRHVYTPVALIEKYRQLEAIVQARGQARFSELEDELKIPGDILEKWVHKLARKQILSGFVDWQERTLTSLEAGELADQEHCPHCGGEMNLAGMGLIQCKYCEVGVFLAGDKLPEIPETAQKADHLREDTPGLLYGEPHLEKAAQQPGSGQRLRYLFKPSKTVRRWLLLILPVVIFSGVCSLTMLFTSGSHEVLDLFLILQSLFILPAIALILVVALFLEKRNPPRTIIAAAAVLVISLAGLAMTTLMAIDPDEEITLAVSSIILMVAPLFLVFSLPVVYFGVKSWPEIQAVLRLGMGQRLRKLVEQRGAISFSEVAQALLIPLDEVDNLADGLLRSGDLYGTMDSQRGWIYTAQYLEQKQADLIKILQQAGQINLEELAAQLALPVDMVPDMIYQAVQANQFQGYIDWRNRVLYSAAAEKLADQTLCPHCGGSLGLAGSAIVCQHCGSEIFR